MGSSVDSAYAEKSLEDIRRACRSLEKFGYDSIVIVISRHTYLEIGSTRGRKFLEAQSCFTEEFCDYCKDDSLAVHKNEDNKELPSVEIKPSNQLKEKLLVKLPPVRKQPASVARPKQKPAVVVISPKEPTSPHGLQDLVSEVQMPEIENEVSAPNTTLQEPVKGNMIPKNNIIVITESDVKKTGSESMNYTSVSTKRNAFSKTKIPGEKAYSIEFPRKTYNCDKCDKKYLRREDLVIHMRKHTGERPYSCRKCDKTFISGNCLRAHMQIHFNDTPFRCNECGQLFARKVYLNRHMRNVHTDEYSHICDICGRGFKDPSGKYYHKLTHTQDKNFTCETCGKAFLRQRALNSHRLIHTGEKPFTCPVCSAQFRMKKNLVTHQRNKHACF